MPGSSRAATQHAAASQALSCIGGRRFATPSMRPRIAAERLRGIPRARVHVAPGTPRPYERPGSRQALRGRMTPQVTPGTPRPYDSPSRRALRGRVTPHSEVAAPSEDARTGDYGGSHRERPERATVDADRDRAQTGLVGKPREQRDTERRRTQPLAAPAAGACRVPAGTRTGRAPLSPLIPRRLTRSLARIEHRADPRLWPRLSRRCRR